MARVLERAASETQFLTGSFGGAGSSDEGQRSIATIDAQGEPLVYFAEKNGERMARIELVGSTSGPRPGWLHETLSKLIQVWHLPRNWDGYDARPIAPVILEEALQALLQSVPPTAPVPYVVPSPSGGLQIEWHEPWADVELEFKIDGTASFYMERDSSEVEQTVPASQVGELVRHNLGPVFAEH